MCVCVLGEGVCAQREERMRGKGKRGEERGGGNKVCELGQE